MEIHRPKNPNTLYSTPNAAQITLFFAGIRREFVLPLGHEVHRITKLAGTKATLWG